MKMSNFVNQNSDVLIAPFTVAEFDELTEGRVFFCVTTGAGHNPVMDRQVRTAGYQLVVSTRRNNEGKLTEAITLALTQGGYAKIESVTRDDVLYACAADEAAGNKRIYHCVPLPPNDPRGRNGFLPKKEV